MAIRTLLIANRGEIARRIIRTCRRMGIAAVAVYSDADRFAPHVTEADRAVHIGPAAASASYLDMESVIAAAKTSGADAIHPGYGFLAENADFAERCVEEGITFVGPSPAAIRRMGSKIAAKAVAEATGVATVPGYAGNDQSDTALWEAAVRLGAPLLIKASAGGGGRGMRIVDDLAGFDAALAAARAEAKAAFGDDAVLLERHIPAPRHIEVQLLCDRHGHALHLFERDCSIQRNHQKVIEEAPAPDLPDPIRDRLLADAVTLAKTIGYDSVGTVEFLWQPGGSTPWFLEMNTRLQVEHPVTEAITGLDLVEWQIRVAAGEPLALTQDAIAATGHAIEARVAAEDPGHDYLPQVGTVTRYAEPADDGIRVDSAVTGGTNISAHYDSMIAKVIAHGATREDARTRLRRALAGTVIDGLGTNLAFLGDIVDHDRFAAARLDTGFLAAAFAGGWRPRTPDHDIQALAAAVAWLTPADDAPSPWSALTGWRVTAAAGRPGASHVHVRFRDGRVAELRIHREQDRLHVSLADSIAVTLRRVSVHGTSLRYEADGVEHTAPFSRHGEIIIGLESIAIRPPEAVLLGHGDTHAAHHGTAVVAPMPGLVTEIRVKPGDMVKRGDIAVLFEAMKMVQSLAVPADGVVRAVHCTEGAFAEGRAVLIELQE